jgi:uncharacterized protein YukE
VSGEEPDVGDPAGTTALAGHWHDRADAVQDALAKIGAASDVTASPSWKGEAQTRFAALLDDMRPSATGLVALFDAAGDAFDQYAKDVQRIKDDADAIRLQRATLAIAVSAQQSAMPALERAAKADGATEADATSLSNAQRAVTENADQSSALDAQWDQLVLDRAAADAALLRVITGPETLGRLGSIDGRGVGLSDADLASTLATLSPTELGALLMLDRDLADRLGAMSPEDVAAFWKALGGGQDTTGADHTAAQDALIGAGEQDLADAKERREGLGWPASQSADMSIDAAQANLDAYRNIEKTLASSKEPGRALLTLDTGHEPPLAAVAVGDVDTASNVSYMVPGMGTTTKDMSGWTTAAQNLWQTQDDLEDSGGSHAVVAWINYEPPPVPSGPTTLGVLNGDAARVGADRLADDLLGFQSSRADPPTLNVVAHSYGTTTAADTLHGKGVHVDNFVSVASAGIEGDVGGAAGIDADHVYAGQGTSGLPTKDPTDNPRDQWAWLGRLGSGRENPMDSSFGATTFGTNGGDPSEGVGVTMHDPIGYGGGDGYFDLGTESVNNVARATVADGTGMTPADDAGVSEHDQTLLDNMMGPSL